MKPDLLSRHSVMRTTSVDEFEHKFRAVYGGISFSIDDAASLNCRANFVQLTDIALGFTGTGSPLQVGFGESSFALLQLALTGKATTQCGSDLAFLKPGKACISTAGRPTLLDRGRGFEHLFLRASSEGINRKLSLLLDTRVGKNVEFSLDGFKSPFMLDGLRSLVAMLAHELNAETVSIAKAAIRELEQALIVQLLYTGLHNYTEALEEEPASPSLPHVRKVQAYIEDNWSRAILLEDLVTVSGVSSRSLYKGFFKTIGYTPMAYVKRIRLDHARRLLIYSNETTTVTGVALACRFLNLGHFAKDYRAAFGEPPSETLRRSGSTPR